MGILVGFAQNCCVDGVRTLCACAFMHGCFISRQLVSPGFPVARLDQCATGVVAGLQASHVSAARTSAAPSSMAVGAGSRVTGHAYVTLKAGTTRFQARIIAKVRREGDPHGTYGTFDCKITDRADSAAACDECDNAYLYLSEGSCPDTILFNATASRARWGALSASAQQALLAPSILHAKGGFRDGGEMWNANTNLYVFLVDPEYSWKYANSEGREFGVRPKWKSDRSVGVVGVRGVDPCVRDVQVDTFLSAFYVGTVNVLSTSSKPDGGMTRVEHWRQIFQVRLGGMQMDQAFKTMLTTHREFFTNHAQLCAEVMHDALFSSEHDGVACIASMKRALSLYDSSVACVPFHTVMRACVPRIQNMHAAPSSVGSESTRDASCIDLTGGMSQPVEQDMPMAPVPVVHSPATNTTSECNFTESQLGCHMLHIALSVALTHCEESVAEVLGHGEGKCAKSR
jgi:hypothetical protein